MGALNGLMISGDSGKHPYAPPIACAGSSCSMHITSKAAADPHGAMQVNQIRASLALMARNSTAFGLRQPHLERTHLCELEDGQLDPGYVAQRSQLRELVFSLAKPKARLLLWLSMLLSVLQWQWVMHMAVAWS